MGILTGLAFVLVIMTLREAFKLLRFKKKTKIEATLIGVEQNQKPFIEASPELHIDSKDIDAKNQLITMKYKMKMFKIRNKFYQS